MDRIGGRDRPLTENTQRVDLTVLIFDQRDRLTDRVLSLETDARFSESRSRTVAISWPVDPA